VILYFALQLRAFCSQNYSLFQQSIECAAHAIAKYFFTINGNIFVSNLDTHRKRVIAIMTYSAATRILLTAIYGVVVFNYIMGNKGSFNIRK
jgi:hypothetical protein